MRLFKFHPLLKLVNSYVVDSPQPSNLSYWWNFGSLLALSLIIQIITGVTLAMHYDTDIHEAFNSVENIMRNVYNGWLIRYLHSNTASAFFLIVYLHIGRGLYYGSYKMPRTLVWTIGTIIFILMMGTAFLGYVLPFGQMSLWGATVITSLMSAIPWVGQDIVEFIWGGFSVNHATLNRFFALHFVLPFILAALALMHLIALHDKAGSGNPLGISSNPDRLPFAPYFIFKDLITIFIYILVLSIFVFYMPNVLGDSENYVMANSMQTPPAIVPEWYLLPFYAILRSIPNKLLGVIAMFSAILMLLVLAFADMSRLRGVQFKPLSKIMLFFFVAVFLVLTQLGAKHVESPFIEFGQVCTIIYFAYFLIIVPYFILFENALSEFSLDKRLLENTVSGHQENKNTNQIYAISKNLDEKMIEEKVEGFIPHPIKIPAYGIAQSNLLGGCSLLFKNNIKSSNSLYLTNGFHTSSSLNLINPSLPSTDPNDPNYPTNTIETDDAIDYSSDSSEWESEPEQPLTLPQDALDYKQEFQANVELRFRAGGYEELRDELGTTNSPSLNETTSQEATALEAKGVANLNRIQGECTDILEKEFPDREYCDILEHVHDVTQVWKTQQELSIQSTCRSAIIDEASNATQRCERTLEALKDAKNKVDMLELNNNAVSQGNDHEQNNDNTGQVDNEGQNNSPEYPESNSDAPRPWGVYFQDSGTSQMEILTELHDNILFYLIIILFGVGWLLVTIINKFGNMAWPLSQRFTSHGTTIEIIWTITPGIILILIAFPSFKLLYLMDEITDPIIVINGEGHQWYWSYQYIDFKDDDNEILEFDSYLIPETDLQSGGLRMLEVDNRLVLPELTHMRFVVSGADVIHSFACPSLGLKCDAYPGRMNQSSLMINRLGTFFGQCSEICGLLHSSMPIVFEAVSVEKFIEWVRQE